MRWLLHRHLGLKGPDLCPCKEIEGVSIILGGVRRGCGGGETQMLPLIMMVAEDSTYTGDVTRVIR